MTDVKGLAAVLRTVTSAVERKRRTLIVGALRECADKLERDPRPVDEAAPAIFCALLARMAAKLGVDLEELDARGAAAALTAGAARIQRQRQRGQGTTARARP